MKPKNDVHKYLIPFEEQYKNLIDKRIKCMRADNDHEFVNTKIDEFLEQRGITHEKTVPYNPENFVI